MIEERNGEIEFRVVNNDNSRESFIILTGLKCIFQKQLPKMPKDYIARLVYDRTHLSIAIVKKPLEVVGYVPHSAFPRKSADSSSGITYRPFNSREFAEIVFCAISSDQQVKGYGAHLMSHLKDYVKATSPIKHFLTYADNYAIGYFKKQGFTKEITLDKPRWMGYIKDYEGGTIMQCTMVPKIRYLEVGRMLLKQKEAVQAKIRAFSKSHMIHLPPKEWKGGPCKINPLDIPAIKASGWSPDMDELARQPRHGPNYNQLLHLLNDMQNHTSSWPFTQPVNRDEVADYYDVIKEPMDLSTMEEKHEKDLYPSPEDFIKDSKLIFDNCRRYNNETTPYAKSATKLEKFMWQKIKEIPEWSVSLSLSTLFLRILLQHEVFSWNAMRKLIFYLVSPGRVSLRPNYLTPTLTSNTLAQLYAWLHELRSRIRGVISTNRVPSEEPTNNEKYDGGTPTQYLRTLL